MGRVARCPHRDRTLNRMLLILNLHSVHSQAQVGVCVTRVRFSDYGATQCDPSLVGVGAQFLRLSDMTEIRQVGKGEAVTRITEEQEESTGGDSSHIGVIPTQGEDWEQDDQGQWRTERVRGGDAGELGGAEVDEGPRCTCHSRGEVTETRLSLS